MTLPWQAFGPSASLSTQKRVYSSTRTVLSPPLPTPPSLTESPRSPSRDLLNGTASPCHRLLAGDIKGHPRNYGGMRRLQPKGTLTGCHPPLPSTPPLSPFEAVFADFFDYRGCHYLVIGDRLSGWVEVLSSTAGTNLDGSAGLVHHLHSFFTTFGVPEEISSDGGPEFTAKGTQDFHCLWGVRHRVSSIRFPQLNGKQPSASCCLIQARRAASTMTASYVPCYNYATARTQIATSHPRKSYLATP